MNRLLRNEAETLAFGAELCETLIGTPTVYLYGDLGSGKTTLVRGFLYAMGYCGKVKSPTFTLVEEYNLRQRRVVHFDLYRLADPEELEWIGIREYFDSKSIAFVEWPEKGSGFLPPADFSIRLSQSEDGRMAEIVPIRKQGENLD